MPKKERIDMTGLRFGRLVGVGFAHKDGHGHCHWVFACDCGSEIVAHGGNVRSGSTTSCGCRHRELASARLIVHGDRARRRHLPTYRAWQTMKSLCSNPRVVGYDRCGGVGIGVDLRWAADFTAFVADMGERPADTTLRRLDEAADFTRSNCQWSKVPSRADRANKAWQRRREQPRCHPAPES